MFNDLKNIFPAQPTFSIQKEASANHANHQQKKGKGHLIST